MSILSKLLNYIKNAIYIIITSTIIKSIIIKLIRRLIIFLIIIIMNKEINKRAIIIITKATKNLNSIILNLNRSLRILMYRKFMIIA